MEDNIIFPKGQIGLRRDKGTNDCINTITCDINKIFTQNTFLTAYFCMYQALVININLLSEKCLYLGLSDRFSINLKKTSHKSA